MTFKKRITVIMSIEGFYYFTDKHISIFCHFTYIIAYNCTYISVYNCKMYNLLGGLHIVTYLHTIIVIVTLFIAGSQKEF